MDADEKKRRGKLCLHIAYSVPTPLSFSLPKILCWLSEDGFGHTYLNPSISQTLEVMGFVCFIKN